MSITKSVLCTLVNNVCAATDKKRKSRDKILTSVQNFQTKFQNFHKHETRLKCNYEFKSQGNFRGSRAHKTKKPS